MNQRYPAAPWSGFLKGVSAVISLLLLGCALLLALGTSAHAGSALRLVLICVLPAIVIVSALFVVVDYELCGRTLRIRRLFWHTRIDLGGLRDAEADPQAATGSIRLFGNGGLFSFNGWFRNPRLGMYRAFVTDWEYAVVLRTEQRTLVVSPADPATFVRDVRAALSQALHATARAAR